MFHKRLLILLAILTAWLVLIGGRLAWLQLYMGPHYRQMARAYPTRQRHMESLRGSIVTQDGVVLAEDRAAYQLAMHYRYLRRPLDEDWLQHEAARRRTTEDAVREDADRLWQDVAAMTGTPLAVLRDRAMEIQDRVERIRELVNRARLADGRAPVRAVREERQHHVILPLPPERSLEIIAQIESDPERYRGLEVLSQTRRVYPQGRLAAHIVGWVGAIPDGDSPAEAARRQACLGRYPPSDLRAYRPTDPIGVAGVEWACEDLLRGWRGRSRELLDADNLVHRVLEHVEPRRGQDVRLTLHAGLQAYLETLLEKAPGGPLHGAIVVLDVHTGAVLAAASNPGFVALVQAVPRYEEALARLQQALGVPSDEAAGRYDELLARARQHPAAAPALARDMAVLEEILRYSRPSDDEAPCLNRAIQMALPPGSVFKVITAVAALHCPESQITADSVIDCKGHVLADRDDIFRCMIYRRARVGHGRLNIVEAIEESCNVFFCTCGQAMGLERLTGWAWRFGFGRPTGIDLPHERSGLLPTPATLRARLGRGVWPGDVLNLSIGQGCLEATPMQIARAMAAIANDGWLVTPHVAAAHYQPPTRIPDVQSDKLALVREGMRRVVMSPTGTAYVAFHADLPDFPVAGKTGTAQSGRKDHDHAWFAGFAPADRPRIALAVALPYAGPGGAVAAPLARKAIHYLRQTGYFAPAYPPRIETAQSPSEAARR